MDGTVAGDVVTNHAGLVGAGAWAPVVRRHRRLQAFGLFVRLSALGTTLAVPLLGAASVSPGLPWRTAAVIVIVAFGYHLFAYVLNDVVDLPIDRHEPRRAVSPLVRGTVRPGHALALALAAVPLTLAVAAAASGAEPGGGRAVAALATAFVLMAVYDLWGKRSPVPWLLDLVQGLGWAALLLYGAAVRGPWTALTWWLFAFWTCFIVLANGVHGGLRDLENDARCGARSTAIVMGARADAGGRLVVPRRTVAYAWTLHAALLAIVLGAWSWAGLGYGWGTNAATLLAILALTAAGGWALSEAVSAGGDPATLRLAGTLHLLLLMALPVALLLPSLRPGFRALVVLGFLVPLAGLGWMPDLVRWAGHPLGRRRLRGTSPPRR
jgi:4-hydroxybenzoate polyprenyltransferase